MVFKGDPGNPVAFGLYEVMLIPRDEEADENLYLSETVEDFVNLGYAQSFQGTIDQTVVHATGNDKRIASEGFDESLTGTLEQTGLNLHSAAMMMGHVAVSTGSSPNRITTLVRNVNTARPTFGLRSRSRSSMGGVFETLVPNAQALGGPNGTQGYGAFMSNAFPITANPNVDGDLVQWTEYETTPVDASPPPPSPPPGP